MIKVYTKSLISVLAIKRYTTGSLLLTQCGDFKESSTKAYPIGYQVAYSIGKCYVAQAYQNPTLLTGIDVSNNKLTLYVSLFKAGQSSCTGSANFSTQVYDNDCTKLSSSPIPFSAVYVPSSTPISNALNPGVKVT